MRCPSLVEISNTDNNIAKERSISKMAHSIGKSLLSSLPKSTSTTKRRHVLNMSG
jgi:hypothetical protein